MSGEHTGPGRPIAIASDEEHLHLPGGQQEQQRSRLSTHAAL
jgi:hypothetical protein